MTPRRVLQALLAASLVGCSGDSTGPDENPHAESIQISPSSVTLAALGATAQLVGTVMDQHGKPMAGTTVSWSSSAPGTAGVSSAGVVTAVSNGDATVTARSGGVSASVDVKVEQAPVSLQVSTTELDFSALDDTIRVVAVVKDANGNPVADAQVTWSSSDASVATVDGTGLVTAVGQGTATLTATAGTASSSVSVTVDAERVVITTDVLPYARLDRDYSLPLEANAERWVFAWSVASGRLPTGLELTDDGVLTGRPREPGTATFTLRAVDRVKDREATRDFTLEVYCGSDLCASTAYNAWFYGNYSYNSAGLALSNAALQHSAPWGNAGMDHYGRLPRVAFLNDASDGDYQYMAQPWLSSYRALGLVAEGLRALDVPEIAAEAATDREAYEAFAPFVRAMALATVGILYDRGLADEGLSEPSSLIDHEQLMAEALALFDEASERAGTHEFSVPYPWMRVELDAEGFGRIVHSMKARYRAASARSPAERQALPWAEILADVAAGITEDMVVNYDDDTYWHWEAPAYGTYFGWSQLSPFLYGMADQSGNYQRWVALPLSEKSYQFADETPVLFITPDLRFPQGTTVEEQRASETPERYFRINRAGVETGYTWARPDRGTWRWSWYKHNRFEDYWQQLDYDVVEMPRVEMTLLKAEGLYYMGDLAGAAALINETRVAAGLSPTDASGTNTSCVPKLPDGSCGDLFEMLKWEKRVEGTFKGPLAVPWFFDGRGWGDLWKDSFLELPVPCSVMQAEHLGACATFGGPGGLHAAPRSSYGWPDEG